MSVDSDADADADVDLNEADRAVLEQLERGRCTAAYLERRTDWSRGYITQRLTRLEEHGVVTNLEGVGLYELRSPVRPADREGGPESYQ